MRQLLLGLIWIGMSACVTTSDPPPAPLEESSAAQDTAVEPEFFFCKAGSTCAPAGECVGAVGLRCGVNNFCCTPPAPDL